VHPKELVEDLAAGLRVTGGMTGCVVFQEGLVDEVETLRLLNKQASVAQQGF
jgi:hypothetical protein